MKNIMSKNKIITFFKAHQHKAVDMNTKQSVKQQLQCLLILTVYNFSFLPSAVSEIFLICQS